jgi:hypothetical protein
MRATRLAWWAFGLAVAAAVVAAVAPLGTRMTAGSGVVARSEHVSMLEVDGSWVLVVVAVPTIVAGIPSLVRRRGVTIASAVVLWACCIVGMWSVGLFFVPSAVLMTLATAARPSAEAVPARLDL